MDHCPIMTTVSHGLDPAHLAEIPHGLDHTGGPVLAGSGLAWVHPVLAHTALESRGTVTEIGRATVNTETSILAQGRDFCACGEINRSNKAKKGGRAPWPQTLS